MRRYSTVVLVLLLAVIQGGLLGVDAQTKLNIGGDSACALRDRLNEGSCGKTTSKRDTILATGTLQQREDSFSAKPSACTCNTPFFNIWSACELFELRSNSLPLMKDWQANCTSASVSFDQDIQGTAIGEIPKWALTNAPGDGSLFDVVGVVLAVAPKPWSPIQIIMPLLSAVGTLLFVAIVSFVRRGSGLGVFNRPRFRFSNSSRVQSEEPKNDWVIDKERMDQIAPYPMAVNHRQSESLTEVQIISQPTFQPNRPACHVPPLPIITPEYVEEEELGVVPLTSRWSDSEHTAPTPTPPSKKLKKNLVPKMFKAIPNPFKARPVRVKPVAPRAGFRLDDYDVKTASISTSNMTPVEEPDRMSVGSSMMRDEDEEQQERLTLISTAERRENEVFLISKDGENFTISSKTTASRSVVTSSGGNTSIGMDVVSPTASSLTHSWRASGNTQIPPVPQLPPPRLPPPPKAPPPRVKPTISYDRFPLANIQDPPPPTRERSGSESNSKSTRTVPVTVNQTAEQPARPNLLHPPLRPVYESDTYPSSESLHQRSLSQTTPNVQAPHPMPLRRGLSEDDSSSFYLHSQDSRVPTPRIESTMHLRTGSRENLHPRRSDPSMLFPPSVRAAGYLGLVKDNYPS